METGPWRGKQGFPGDNREEVEKQELEKQRSTTSLEFERDANTATSCGGHVRHLIMCECESLGNGGAQTCSVGSCLS